MMGPPVRFILIDATSKKGREAGACGDWPFAAVTVSSDPKNVIKPAITNKFL
jgi:hypothetical protein